MTLGNLPKVSESHFNLGKGNVFYITYCYITSHPKSLVLEATMYCNLSWFWGLTGLHWSVVTWGACWGDGKIVGGAEVSSRCFHSSRAGGWTLSWWVRHLSERGSAAGLAWTSGIWTSFAAAGFSGADFPRDPGGCCLVNPRTTIYR